MIKGKQKTGEWIWQNYLRSLGKKKKRKLAKSAIPKRSPHRNRNSRTHTALLCRKKTKRSCGAVIAWIVFGVVCILLIFYFAVFCYYNFRPPKVVTTENGKTVYEYYRGFDRVKIETEYDKNDRVIMKIKYDDEGMESHRYEYTYNADGVLTEEWEYDYTDLSSMKEYDANGRVVRERAYIFHKDKPDKTYKYEYDADGRLTVKYLYDEAEKYTGREEYQYDADGNLAAKYEYDEAGKLLGHYEYEYEKDSDRSRWKYYDPSGKLIDSSDNI